MKKTDTNEYTYEIELYTQGNEYRIENVRDFGYDYITLTSMWRDSGFRSGYIEYEISMVKTIDGVTTTEEMCIPEWEIPKKFPNAKFVKNIMIFDDELTKKCST